MQSKETSVLVVGGSLVGLSAGIFLSRQGVPTVIVEKHPRSSLHPRAMGFTPRTMELYRAVGLGPQIPQVQAGMGRPRRVSVESLAGKWTAEETAWTPEVRTPSNGEKSPSKHEYSICSGAAIPQDRLEPILRKKATELGTDIRLSTTLVSFEQNNTGVTALLRSNDGHEYLLTADYMIGADGASSQVRGALGIDRDGRGPIQTMRSVLFSAPLDHYLESGISQFEIHQSGLNGMLTTYRDGRWLLMFMDDQERDEPTLNAMIQRAIGRSDLPVEIITTGRWQLTALIARRFSSGRVFLAGDSAHTLPPARGGYGANAGIEDAHNLAWKLASVLSGQSTPELLDTYDAERRPVAWLRHGQIFARPDYQQFSRPADREVPIIDDDAMELGQLYRSAAVIGAGEGLPPALRPDQWAGQPGTRAPHVWVSRNGIKVSTLDLVQPDWVLITEDDRWCPAAQAVAQSLKIKLVCVTVACAGEAAPTAAGSVLDMPIAVIVADAVGRRIFDAHLPQVIAHPNYESCKTMSLRQLLPLAQGKITEEDLAKTKRALANVQFAERKTAPDDPEAFRKVFGIGLTGASLVRPDGYIAWRALSLPLDPTADLIAAVRQAVAAKPAPVRSPISNPSE